MGVGCTISGATLCLLHYKEAAQAKYQWVSGVQIAVLVGQALLFFGSWSGSARYYVDLSYRCAHLEVRTFLSYKVR